SETVTRNEPVLRFAQQLLQNFFRLVAFARSHIRARDRRLGLITRNRAFRFLIVCDRLVEFAFAFVQLSTNPIVYAEIGLEITLPLDLLPRFVVVASGVKGAREDRVDN